MTRSTWNELPAAVRAAIEAETGPVAHTEAPSAGRHSDFSATLHLHAGGRVFCKGIADAEGTRGAMHRHEADVNPYLPAAIAPRLCWRSEAEGWLLLGFEHVTGHHADLAPGSADLQPVTATLAVLTTSMTRYPAGTRRLGQQWARLAAWRRLAKAVPADLDEWARVHFDELVEWEYRAVELVEGDTLIHTDLHPLNILVDGERAQVVDWAWSRLGAPAVDVAFLVTRLIAAGHTPTAAERWADELSVWRETPDIGRTAFAVAIWGIWEYLEREHPLPHRAPLTAAARAWAKHLLA